MWSPSPTLVRVALASVGHGPVIMGGMGKVELNKRRTILGIGTAHPLPSSCSCLAPGTLIWATRSVVVGRVLVAPVVVTSRGLGKKVVSDMELLVFFKTYNFSGTGTTTHPPPFLACCCCDCVMGVDVLHRQGGRRRRTIVVASPRWWSLS